VITKTAHNERFHKIAALPSLEKKCTFARWLLRRKMCESRNLVKPPPRCRQVFFGKIPRKKSDHKENLFVKNSYFRAVRYKT